jgi:copper resistance protein D
MSWLAAEIDGPLVLTRAIHFAASAATAGILMFRVVVAGPALRSSADGYATVERRLVGLTWAGLIAAVATGVVWLVLLTMSMSGLAFTEAMRSGAMLAVVSETQYGLVSGVRGGLAVLLAACLLLNRFRPFRWGALVAGLGLVGAIAWTGHAGSTLGELGDLHLTADVLHLLAASAWIGGLAGLCVLFAICRRRPEWGSLLLDAIRRFSALGMVSVALLIATGLVNSWVLVGSKAALLQTDYGQLLLFKIGVFAVMFGFATVNRFWLTSQLEPKGDPAALAALTRNTIIEIALALAIFAIVGQLGTMHPAIHMM